MKRRLRPETLLRRFKTHCVLCRRRIPMKRQRRASITCGKEHQKLLRKMRKIERDHRLCSRCGRPVSPDEKTDFRRWRASKDVQAHPKNHKAANHVRASAMGTQKLSDIAYVVVESPKRRVRRTVGLRRSA